MSVPGESAQLLMAPEIRTRALKKLGISKRITKNAAIMMLLYPKNDDATLALIERPIYKGVHSGQIALPGGKTEPFDQDYKETALRETWEEIGVPSEDVNVLKLLTKTFIPPSNYWVHPYLGYCDSRPEFIKQDDEVANIIEIPISSLLNEKNVVSKKLTTSYATDIDVPAFELNGYIVWGATAMMLNELKVFLSQLIAG